MAAIISIDSTSPFQVEEYKPDDDDWCAWMRMMYNALPQYTRPTPGNKCATFSLYNYLKHNHIKKRLSSPTPSSYENIKRLIKQMNDENPDCEMHKHPLAQIYFNRKGYVVRDDTEPYWLMHYAVVMYYTQYHGLWKIGVDGSVKFTAENWKTHAESLEDVTDMLSKYTRMMNSNFGCIFKMDDYWYYPCWANSKHARQCAIDIFYANRSAQEIAEFEAFHIQHGDLCMRRLIILDSWENGVEVESPSKPNPFER